DVVGYGATPEDCIDFLAERGIETICGNHDYLTYSEKKDKIQPYAEYVIKWMQDKLDRKYINWLSKLPFKLSLENIEFAHASLECTDGRYWPYVLDQHTAQFHFFCQTKTISASGHTHIPLLIRYKVTSTTFELLKNCILDLTENEKVIINPGSVGQPRDLDPRASSVIFDLKRNCISVIRAEYDIAKAQKDIIKAGLPKNLASRLSAGM
ncbi:MAG TPA: metallophosphoesterase family protein, partial [Victivallales bacterium]|nr:metallophosphoesterase family protein [Victivallales bacterium]